MGNTVFYRQLNENASQISWGDIFSEFRKKHTKEDLEYALAAGTALNSATEETMLQRWRKPWVFYPVLKWGIVLILVLYAAYFGLTFAGRNVVPALGQMAMIIPPLIPEIVLMICFWELNIPRNISVLELFLVWLLGGLASLAIASVLFTFQPEAWDELAHISAPLAEEPAKLIPALIILFLMNRNKKVYGITGFVVGAAVGAGFAAFESVQYAFTSGTNVFEFADGSVLVETSMSMYVVKTQVVRILTAIAGHVLYCAPYSAEFARHTKNGKINAGCFFNIDFLLAFIISCTLHGIWDWDLPRRMIPGGIVGLYVYLAFLSVIVCFQALRILRKCLNQVVRIGAAASGGAALEHGASDKTMAWMERLHPSGQEASVPQPSPAPQAGSSVAAAVPQSSPGEITINCSRGVLRGMSWHASGNEVLTVGRDNGCKVLFPQGSQGVSGRHCSIQLTSFGWTVKDLGSSYGTIVSGGQKLLPGTEIRLKQGDVISLGGNENELTVKDVRWEKGS